MRYSASIMLVLATMHAGSLTGGAAPSTTPAKDKKQATVNEIHPGLASSGLAYAVPAELPDGVLLHSGEVQVTRKDLDGEIAKSPNNIQEQFKRNAFFLLEQIATQKLLLGEPKTRLGESKKDPRGKTDQQIINEYLEWQTAGVRVGDDEITAFYEKNREMFDGTGLTQIKGQLGQYLLQQKRQEAIRQWIVILGKRHEIRVASGWVEKQAVLARDNPVGEARNSGRPSLVDFGSEGCRPCDMLAPILETLKKKYKGKANVIFVSIRDEQVLAARYGIRSIPVQIFFDKKGKEVFRHVGFWGQQELEKKLTEMGVK